MVDLCLKISAIRERSPFHVSLNFILSFLFIQVNYNSQLDVSGFVYFNFAN